MELLRGIFTGRAGSTLPLPSSLLAGWDGAAVAGAWAGFLGHEQEAMPRTVG